MLFILGHMRTGSSLLAHILASHQNVLGYGETHNVYTRPEDFGATTATVRRHLRRVVSSQEKYLLDKVLHKHQIAEMEVLNHSSVRVIFMIRRSDMALSSIIQNVGFIQKSEQAYQHYAEQVEWVGTLAEALSSDRWTSTTYTELTQETNTVLSRLEPFLDLSEPLTEHYDTNRYTGVSGIGDPGPHIESGYIKPNIDRDVDPRIRSHLDRAWERFESCAQLLRDGDQLVDSGSA